jgi:hypothetical protein
MQLSCAKNDGCGYCDAWEIRKTRGVFSRARRNALGSSAMLMMFSDDWKLGAGDGDRTHDIQLGKLAFYR